jgi:hypothetical protein
VDFEWTSWGSTIINDCCHLRKLRMVSGCGSVAILLENSRSFSSCSLDFGIVGSLNPGYALLGM